MRFRLLLPALLLLVVATVVVVPLLQAQTGPALGYQAQVFVVGSDGAGLQQVTKGKGTRYSPTWSRDGRRVAYADGAIVVVTLESGNRRALARSRRFGRSNWVAWSPARDEILFRHRTEDHSRTGIATIGADGRGVRRLTSWASSRSPLGGPEWSPDGNRIAYLREGRPVSKDGVTSGGDFDIAVVSRTRTPDRRVRLRGDERQPLWSPNGKWLLFGRENTELRPLEDVPTRRAS